MWPFTRRQDPVTDKSRAALHDAQVALGVVTDRHPEVLEVTRDLRKIRKDNHFSDHLTRIIAEGPK
jgi:hypothetical protein